MTTQHEYVTPNGNLVRVDEKPAFEVCCFPAQDSRLVDRWTAWAPTFDLRPVMNDVSSRASQTYRLVAIRGRRHIVKEVKTTKTWQAFLARYGGDFDLLGLTQKVADVSVELAAVNARDDPQQRLALGLIVRGGSPNWSALVDHVVDMTRQLAPVARLHNAAGHYNDGVLPLGGRGYAALWHVPDGSVGGYGWMTLSGETGSPRRSLRPQQTSAFGAIRSWTQRAGRETCGPSPRTRPRSPRPDFARGERLWSPSSRRISDR